MFHLKKVLFRRLNLIIIGSLLSACGGSAIDIPIDSESTSINIPATIQAENFSTQSGITVETTDTDSESIGFIENNDYTEYLISVPSSGTYTIDVRASSATSGGTINIEENSLQIGSVYIDNTGGWQSWRNTDTTIELSEGEQTLRLSYSGDEGYLMNINLFTITARENVTTISALVHPGGWHSQADLNLIRTKVAAEEEPWITGWNAIKDESPYKDYTTNPSELIVNNGAMHTAGFSAWVLTMKWVASGEQGYADAAIAIIDTWVEVVRDFDVYGPTLTLSTGAGAMAQAAEILEHGFNGEAGWAQEDADAAKAWFKEFIYDTWTNTGDFRSTNWGTSALGGNMSMAVFMDDLTEFEYQRDAYLYGYQDTDDGCAAVTDYIFDPSGQAQETGRDQAHVQGGIGHLTETALVAWNQGVDLVGVAENRLLAGVEYHAKYNLGYDDLPFTQDVYNPCDLYLIGQWSEAISEEERGGLSPVYYMSAKLFTNAGLDHPYTQEVLVSDGYSPEINNFAHPGLGTLVFQPVITSE